MARYTVHVPTKARSRTEALERAIFVRDGWSWGALFLAPLWLLWHRHWLTGVIALVFFFGLGVGLRLLPMPEWSSSITIFAIHALFALEGATLRRFSLWLSGHIEEGVVVGDDKDALERRFFETILPASAEPVQPAANVHAGPAAAPAGPLPVLGLFPEARKHP